jgi:D-galactarolactone cycloisomerase
VKIQRVEAFPISLPRDRARATGTAGSPTALQPGAAPLRWSSTVRTVYSERFETTLVRVTLDDGRTGWGEAQAPVAPRVAATIAGDILAPVLQGAPFTGARADIEHLWNEMFDCMRVRGQTGGFMLDAIAGVDLALWDLAGQIAQQPVARLLASDRSTVPAYLSGLAGATLADRLAFAQRHFAQGFRQFKLFYDGESQALLDLLDALRAALGPAPQFAVDALWRLEWPRDHAFCEALAARNLLWLEAPFMPDLPAPHRELARALPHLPLALGESYRTRREMSWFLEERLVQYAQPDLGRVGITETLRIAECGIAVVPHVSVALGPQIAAAIHTAAAVSPLCEYNPAVFEVANQYLEEPLQIDGAAYRVPAGQGLGTRVRRPPEWNF